MQLVDWLTAMLSKEYGTFHNTYHQRASFSSVLDVPGEVHRKVPIDFSFLVMSNTGKEKMDFLFIFLSDFLSAMIRIHINSGPKMQKPIVNRIFLKMDA